MTVYRLTCSICRMPAPTARSTPRTVPSRKRSTNDRDSSPSGAGTRESENGRSSSMSSVLGGENAGASRPRAGQRVPRGAGAVRETAAKSPRAVGGARDPLTGKRRRRHGCAELRVVFRGPSALEVEVEDRDSNPPETARRSASIRLVPDGVRTRTARKRPASSANVVSTTDSRKTRMPADAVFRGSSPRPWGRGSMTAATSTPAACQSSAVR